MTSVTDPVASNAAGTGAGSAIDSAASSKRQLQAEVEQQRREITELRLALNRESNGRLLAEEALDEARDRIQLALGAAGLALWDWQLASPHIFFTARWAEMLGHVGMDGHWDAADLRERTHPDDRANLRELTARLISGQQRHAKAHFRVRKNSGSWIWIESQAMVAEHDALGKPLRLMGTHADITERKQLEAERELTLAHTQQSENSSKELLDGIRQEIQTPLNALMELMRMLVASPLNADQQGWLEAMDLSAHALLGQLNDVLDASLIETGELDLELVPYRLGETLEELSLLYAQQAQGKSLSWSLQVARDVPEIVKGDPGRLRQVLATLLSNASRFTARGGRIRVMVSLTLAPLGGERQIRIQVSDSGVGIDAAQQAQLFDASPAGLTGPAQHVGSGGLGLPHCAKLVELMGGQIALKSKPGHGSVFTVTLPLIEHSVGNKARVDTPDVAPVAASVAAPPGKVASSRFAGLNVVVAEDHPVNTLLMGQLLRRLGCQVQFAQSGEETVRLWMQGGVDLVLMDVQMPGINGLQATQRIRELEAQRGLARTPIIAVTANSLKGDREDCLAAGMDGFALKPVNPNTLVRTMGEILKLPPEPSEPVSASKPASPSAPLVEQPPAALIPPTAASSLDIDKLRRRLDGDESSLHQLAQAMQADLDHRLQQLKKALVLQNADLAIAHAHGLKGSLASMTAERGARFAKGLELAALARDWSLFARALPLMEAEARQLREALTCLLSEHPSQGD